MNKYDLHNLSIDEKIGQLFVFGFDALEVNDHAIHLIKKYKAGNVILFARNVKTPEQLFLLNQNLQKLALEEIGIPLFITIDQEGGMVTRIKNGATFFPGAMTISASNDLDNALKVGEYMGKELIHLGINMNLAPSLDVNNNPYNPVIGVRSYGDDPSRVSVYGNAFIKGLQKNVIATAKHFPGHGDTTVDSHLALPKIDYDLERLHNVELYPFKKAIEAGVLAIMSSHINFPAFTEDGLPSTLSKKCLTGLLREELKFNGLIITDCMQMKAIQDIYTTEKGTLMAINAGANLICISHAEHLQIGAIEYVKKAFENHEITMDTIDDRVSKILQFKEKYLKVETDMPYQIVQPYVENESTKKIALDIVKSAITIAKGTNVVLNEKTLIIASEPLATTIADESDGTYSVIKMMNKELPNIDTYAVSVSLSDNELEHIYQIQENYTNIIFCSYNANIHPLQITLIKKLLTMKPLHVIAMRNPYDLVFAPEIENLIFLYEYTPNSVVALIEYLKGNIKPSGVCPVEYL